MQSASKPAADRGVATLIVPAALHLIVFCAALGYGFVFLDTSYEDPTPAIRGRMLFDSLAYYDAGRFFDPIASLTSLAPRENPAGIPTGLGLTNLAVVAEGAVARKFMPMTPLVIVVAINYLLLLLTLRAYRRIAFITGLRWSLWLELLVLANPFVLLSLVSLTKEIWGLVFVGAFAVAALEHRYIRLIALAVASAATREFYAIVAVGQMAIATRRVNAVTYLLAVSLAIGLLESVLGLGDITGFRTTASVTLDQQTGDLMEAMGHLQSIPFGHVVAFPVVLMVNLASPMLNPRSYDYPLDYFYVHANTMSSWLSVGLVVIGALRRRRRGRIAGSQALLDQMLAVAIIITLYPISQHRYFLPLYPMLVVWSLAKPSQDPMRTGYPAETQFPAEVAIEPANQVRPTFDGPVARLPNPWP